MDAGYFTDENVEAFYAVGIDFITSLANKKISDEQFQKILDNAGLFVIVSSLLDRAVWP